MKFKQFLSEKEIKYNIIHNQKIIGYYKLDIHNNVVRIADIMVTKSGTGVGTQTIKDIMTNADKNGQIVSLTSDAMRGKISQKMNRELYKKLGFIKNTGKNKLKIVQYEEFYYIGKTYMNEDSNMVDIYHGDDYNTKKIEIKHMMSKDSNNQEGIGIYFGTLDIANSYGKDIISATVNKKRFWGSRNSLSKHTNYKFILSLFKTLHKIDDEPLYYMATDWGIEISQPEDVTWIHLIELAKNMMSEEVRNFQIIISQQFGVINFVEAWNKVFPNNLGTYNKELNFYAIINPKVKVKQI